MIPMKRNYPDVILDFLTRISDRIRKLRENKTAVTIIRLSLASLSIIYLSSSLYQNWEELSQVKLDISWIILAWLATLFSVLLGSLAWWLILRSMGQGVKLSDAVHVHLYSNILKYLPGIGWQQGGKFILSRPLVENNRTILWGMTMEYLFLFSGGIALAMCAFPGAVSSIQIEPIRVLFSSLGEAWFVIIACIIVVVSAYLAYLITRKTAYTRTKLTSTLLTLITILFGWFSLSIALYMLGRGLTSTSEITYPLFIFTTPISFLIGLAVIFVPGGIGVRESVMAYILQWVMSPGLAVLIALFARACIAVAELIAFVFIALIYKVILNSDGVEGNTD